MRQRSHCGADVSVEAARRMTKNYDFVVTSGGIGPTHDDITYESLGKAFGLPLEHDQETMRRMMEITPEKRRRELEAASPEEREARNRMALFPVAKGGHGSDGQGGARSELLFVLGDKWVPVLRLDGKVSKRPMRKVIDPTALRLPRNSESFPAAPPRSRPVPPAPSRLVEAIPALDLHQVSCSRSNIANLSQPESKIAPYLTELQKRVKDEGIRVGSCELKRCFPPTNYRPLLVQGCAREPDRS